MPILTTGKLTNPVQPGGCSHIIKERAAQIGDFFQEKKIRSHGSPFQENHKPWVPFSNKKKIIK